MSRRDKNIEASAPDTYDNLRPVGETATQHEKPVRKGKVARGISEMLTGDILDNEKVKHHYPLAAYIVVLAFIYVLHVYHFQRLQRQEISTRLELNEQRSRAVIFSSMRMNASRHSSIISEIRRRGIELEESTAPPKTVDKK